MNVGSTSFQIIILELPYYHTKIILSSEHKMIVKLLIIIVEAVLIFFDTKERFGQSPGGDVVVVRCVVSAVGRFRCVSVFTVTLPHGTYTACTPW